MLFMLIVYGQFINSKIKINSVVETLATIRGISSQSSLAMLHAKYVEDHVLSKIGTILDLNRYALFLRYHVVHADTSKVSESRQSARRKKERYEDGSSSGDLFESVLSIEFIRLDAHHQKLQDPVNYIYKLQSKLFPSISILARQWWYASAV